jgi:hypothetical protein
MTITQERKTRLWYDPGIEKERDKSSSSQPLLKISRIFLPVA